MKSATHRFRVAKPASPHPITNIDARVRLAEHVRNGVTVQACNRCRRLKKRCSKAPPECDLCVAAGHSCSLAQLTNSSSASPNSPNEVTEATSGSTASVVSSALQRNPSPSLHVVDTRVQLQANGATPPARAEDASYLSYVHAYFCHVHRAYPFLDKRTTLDKAGASTFPVLWADNPDSIVGAFNPCMVQALTCKDTQSCPVNW